MTAPSVGSCQLYFNSDQFQTNYTGGYAIVSGGYNKNNLLNVNLFLDATNILVPGTTVFGVSVLCHTSDNFDTVNGVYVNYNGNSGLDTYNGQPPYNTGSTSIYYYEVVA
jgi:hypothetical protein